MFPIRRKLMVFGVLFIGCFLFFVLHANFDKLINNTNSVVYSKGAYEIVANETDSKFAEKLSKKIYNYITTTPSNQFHGTILYRCHEKYAGGLGDRIRGYIYVFYFALLNGYRFQQRWDFVYPISLFYQNRFPTLSGPDDNPAVWHIEQYQHYKVKDEKFKNNTLEIMTNNYMYTDIFDQPEVQLMLNKTFPYLRNLKRGILASIVLRLAFDETPKLMEHVNMYVSPKSFNIGIQYRGGDMLWGGSPRQNNNVECFVKKTVEVYGNQNKPCFVFITADNFDIIKVLKNRITEEIPGCNVTFVDRPIVHIDLPKAEEVNKLVNDDLKFDYFLKTHLDWSILSRMDTLIISRSGYSESAAQKFLKPTWSLGLRNQDKCEFLDYHKFIADKKGILDERDPR
ncbi:hypothetical protein ROZALSC1DRAFT_20445 [Rozella allomycis CSF55]|uniref:Uncharacterized protein n=1 Tax=Rozella allomycis (strain CSF55) TaxID=988480 RepID=A0A4P9YP49_ROZAC|nr:hypothetical protein ROZALSC1DRAFT_20445 [Rozella allomycis CSF55]